ncbi:hypothetical protein HYH03_015740 [Edaphochlamys debaryana]|uniref:KANL3/Tex30 alpha/beta hydrolase-like domain-containing protein n=1 Tax=Edaphochlamys debaryana TaxID=47281 RepID=A0A835XLB3_9CHLO|nr:hypothetical protein HYH03_015740 [Edaphochlamys debaryana]|eukprot:KAG2485579.1 hypothetical protein HYH03_015740 [Edaphochlamys debaryana]
MVEIEMPANGGYLEGCMTIPGNYNTETGVKELGVILAHGREPSDWRGRLLSELAVGLARAGHLVMRAIYHPAAPEETREAALEKAADVAATSPYARGVTRWAVMGIGCGARLAATVGQRLRSGVAGYVFLSYPLKEDQSADPTAPLLALPAPTLFVSGACDPLASEHALVELAPRLAAADVRSVVVQEVDGHFRAMPSGKGPTAGVAHTVTSTVLDFLAAVQSYRLDACKLPRLWRTAGAAATAQAQAQADAAKAERPPLKRPECFRPIPTGPPPAPPPQAPAAYAGQVVAPPHHLQARAGAAGGAPVLNTQALLQQAAAAAAAAQRPGAARPAGAAGNLAAFLDPAMAAQLATLLLRQQANVAAAAQAQAHPGAGAHGHAPAAPSSGHPLAAVAAAAVAAQQQQHLLQQAAAAAAAAAGGGGGDGGGKAGVAGAGVAEALQSALAQRVAVPGMPGVPMKPPAAGPAGAQPQAQAQAQALQQLLLQQQLQAQLQAQHAAAAAAQRQASGGAGGDTHMADAGAA